MEDEVELICKKLTSTELEEEEIMIDPKEFLELLDRGTNCLLLKLLSICHFNREVFKQMMQKIWHPVKPVKFHELGLGLFLTKFEDPNDTSLVLTKDFDETQQIYHASLSEASF